MNDPQSRLLIVEDDLEYGERLRFMLGSMGYATDVVTSPNAAREAIAVAYDTGDPYTVATVDRNYRGTDSVHEFADGEILVKEIHREHPYLATVMISASEAGPQDVLQLRDDYDVDQFLDKNDGMKPQILKSAIERAVARVERRILNADLPYLPNTPKTYAKPDHITVKPLFGVPSELGALACDAFMIMPFAEDYYHVWEDHVGPTVTDMGLDIKRGDDFFTSHDIIYEIWSAIYASQFVIADLTGANVNVFYELGMAHTLGKPGILIVQGRERIPFDIRNRRVIRYADTPDGLKALEEGLRRAVAFLLEELREGKA